MWEKKKKGCGKNSNKTKSGNQGAKGKLMQLNVLKDVHGEWERHFGSSSYPE